MQDNAQYGCEYVGHRLYRYWIGNVSKYAVSENLPAWARMVWNDDRETRRQDLRQYRIRNRLRNGAEHRYRSDHVERPTCRLNNTQMTLLSIVEGMQPGYSIVVQRRSLPSRIAVNCWRIEDWERHEREALR
jgi:hypothetical protein